MQTLTEHHFNHFIGHNGDVVVNRLLEGCNRLRLLKGGAEHNVR